MTIDLNRLTDESYRVSEYCQWIDQSTTNAELDTIRGVLVAHYKDADLAQERRLTDEEYQVICGWGKKRREELTCNT